MLSILKTRKQFPQGPKGFRVYAVGDIHGRLDLLNELLNRIHAEIDEYPARKTLLIFLGDLIDRGPESRGVIERLRNYRRRGVSPMFIAGNHEEVLLRLLAGKPGLLANWLRFGGAEFLRSYGGDPDKLQQLTEAQAISAISRLIPEEHIEFLRSFSDTFRAGDFLFVHAGIRPGIKLIEQSQADLRWIRDSFLHDTRDHGFIVVHGHTISLGIDEQSNRIGIDTGAYRSGVLSAIGIQGERCWYLDTAEARPSAKASTH